MSRLDSSKSEFSQKPEKRLIRKLWWKFTRIVRLEESKVNSKSFYDYIVDNGVRQLQKIRILQEINRTKNFHQTLKFLLE